MEPLKSSKGMEANSEQWTADEQSEQQVSKSKPSL